MLMQPVEQYIEAAEDDDPADGDAAEAGELGGGGRGPGGAVRDGTKITIDEALEATAFSAGDQPVEPSDAAAIAAAEARASGADEAPPDGLAARARAAADANANAVARRDEDRATLRDVLAVRHASSVPWSRGGRRVAAPCMRLVYTTYY